MIRLTTDNTLSDSAVQVLEELEQGYTLGMEFTASGFYRKAGVTITTRTMQELEEKEYIYPIAPNIWKYIKALPRPWDLTSTG